MIDRLRKILGIFLLAAILAASGLVGPSMGASGAAGASGLVEADIPADVLLDNGFKISFDGVTYQLDRTSTWFYTVEELPEARDLSNWVLETPFCAPILDAGPKHWEIVDPDPNVHLSGVKWETGDQFEKGQFWVRLETTGQVGLTNVAAKGPEVALGELAGPSCVLVEPPVDTGDTTPPTVAWVAPVETGGRVDVRDGDTIDLAANATDDIGVASVRFYRWDAVNEVYLTIAEDGTDPYQAMISASELNPTWNQVFVRSTDTDGNRSDRASIWVYKLVDGPLFGITRTEVFLPLVQH